MKKREEVCVLVDTPEKCKRALQILTEAKEPIYMGTKDRFERGLVMDYNYLIFINANWNGNSSKPSNTAEITLDKLEKMLSPSKEQFLSISRENLNIIYNNVCNTWKIVIMDLYSKAPFKSSNVEIPLKLVKKGYQQADQEQLLLLKQFLPLPKEKVTVEVSVWVNVYEKNVTAGTFISKEKAIIARSGNCVATVELKGSYEIEQ